MIISNIFRILFLVSLHTARCSESEGELKKKWEEIRIIFDAKLEKFNEINIETHKLIDKNTDEEEFNRIYDKLFNDAEGRKISDEVKNIVKNCRNKEFLERNKKIVDDSFIDLSIATGFVYFNLNTLELFHEQKEKNGKDKITKKILLADFYYKHEENMLDTDNFKHIKNLLEGDEDRAFTRNEAIEMLSKNTEEAIEKGLKAFVDKKSNEESGEGAVNPPDVSSDKGSIFSKWYFWLIVTSVIVIIFVLVYSLSGKKINKLKK